MPLQRLRPNVRKHWFREVNRHILTIVLVEALVTIYYVAASVEAEFPMLLYI